MLIVGSYLSITDNSGARIARCIKVFGKTRHKCAYIGDIILVTVRRTVPFEKQRAKFHLKRKLKKGDLFKVLVLRTKQLTKRVYCSFIFFQNAGVLLKAEEILFANRVYGPVSYEMRPR